jgi:FolB domain-containing protein
MTLLLASVTGTEEAEIALQLGADIIDLKDPSKGALSALSEDTVRAAVTAVAGRRPVSAVAGDLPMEPDVVVAAVQAMSRTGVDYVKVGLFPGLRRKECVRALSALTRTTNIVAVMFADQEPDTDLLSLIAECGFVGAMLDTAGKGAGRLFNHADVPVLQDFIGRCRGHGLLTGLAGSLEAPDIPRLLLLSPDFLGFRRALSAGHDRSARIDPNSMHLLRALIPLDDRSRVGATNLQRADERVLAAREYFDGPERDAATDQIFVHDFVVPVRVGAYAHEREKPQNVRFDVDVTAMRIGRAAVDMRDVFSYDVIMDAIRIIVAQEHVPLVETLAERIAAFLLAYPRVARVKVRVEKLDVGPGGVGVEIMRERQRDVAKVYQLYPAAAGNSRSTMSE